ncbi:hypothetical protein KCU64_g2681, partial [Aureobasidium melanogenum]
MGASLSSPQLDDGLVLVSNPNTTGPFTSAFTVDGSDTNSFGFSASMSWMGTAVQAQYTDTANVVKTATCSAQINSYSTYTDTWYDDLGGGSQTMVTYVETFSEFAYGSILCPIANTQIGKGPLVLSVGSGMFWGDATYALYVGRTTATVSPEPSTTTSIVPDRRSHYDTYWPISRISLCGFATLLANNSLHIHENFLCVCHQLRTFFIKAVLKCQLVSIEYFQLSIVFVDFTL